MSHVAEVAVAPVIPSEEFPFRVEITPGDAIKMAGEFAWDYRGTVAGIAAPLAAGILGGVVLPELARGVASADGGSGTEGHLIPGETLVDRAFALAIVATGPVVIGAGNAMRSYQSQAKALSDLQREVEAKEDFVDFDLPEKKSASEEELVQDYLRWVSELGLSPTKGDAADFVSKYRGEKFDDTVRAEREELKELRKVLLRQRINLPVQTVKEGLQGFLYIVGAEAAIAYMLNAYAKDVIKTVASLDPVDSTALAGIGASLLYLFYSGLTETARLQAPYGSEKAKTEAAITFLQSKGILKRSPKPQRPKRPGTLEKMQAWFKNTWIGKFLKLDQVVTPSGIQEESEPEKPRVQVKI